LQDSAAASYDRITIYVYIKILRRKRGVADVEGFSISTSWALWWRFQSAFSALA
jgi:hypothetical protein